MQDALPDLRQIAAGSLDARMKIEAPAELLTEEVVAPTPLLKLWHDWGKKCMVYHQPLLAALSGVSAFSAVMGRDYRGPTTAPPPVSFVLLAASCSGKEGPKNMVSHLFTGKVPHELSFLKSIPAGDGWASDAGVQREMTESPSRLWQIDEMKDYLATATANGAAAYKSGIMRLMKIWYSGEDYKIPALKGSENVVLVQPRATVIGYAQPRVFWDAVPTAIVHDGFMNRFITLPGAVLQTHRNKYVERYSDSFPSEIWGWIKESRDFLGKQAGKPDFGGGFYRIPFEKSAEAYADALDLAYRTEWARLESIGQSLHSALLGRAFESVMRLASVYAFTERKQEIKVSVPGIQWAARIVNYALLNTVSSICLFDNSGDDAATRRYRRVKQLLQSSPEGIGQGVLVNKLHMPKREFDDVIDQMIRNKLVAVFKSKRGGLIYKWEANLLQNEVAEEAERITA
jgi:hypothetical protein